MKKLFCLSLLLLSAFCIQGQKANDYLIEGVTFNKVTLNDSFWNPRVEINRTVTIPASFKKCEETGRILNFEIAAGLKEGKFQTSFPFDDTDPYKIIEGASYSLQVHPDPVLDHYTDSLISLIALAQEPDGYLYTTRTIDPAHPHPWSGSERWVNESVLSHELYNSGHLFEAASAHYLATGKRNLLDVALKNANLLCEVFGPGKRSDAPGHEIVEMGLVRLYRITGEQKYLDLARFFIDCRGKARNPDKLYSQDHIPVIEQTEAVGHAVRAGYLYSGIADVAALTGNTEYTGAIDRIWENMVSKKLYLTGGIGAVHDGERFGSNYELPNLTAYNETCAAIANVYWNYRMFLLHGDSKYIDVMERSLYNNVAAGVSLDGKLFFYPNPLESDAKFKFNVGSLGRQAWFDCSCCPTNVCRFMSSISGYIYAHAQNNLYVNLFIGSKSKIGLKDGQQVTVTQETRYPWEGDILIRIDPDVKSAFNLCVRVPGWAIGRPVPSDLYTYKSPGNAKFTLTVNGKKADYEMKNGYAVIYRTWEKGDIIKYSLPMEIHRVLANKQVEDDRNKIALERGPLVYCIEGTDNNSLDDLIINDHVKLSVNFEPGLLHGIQVIHAKFPAKSGTRTGDIMAIPYYCWDNRGDTSMKVWISSDTDSKK
jgi:uncharacterized protein